MNVASQELCKELCELSGWKSSVDDPSDRYYTPDSRFSDVENARVTRSAASLLWETRHNLPENAVPAYDLGYLLRKLPDFVLEYDGKDNYSCWYNDPKELFKAMRGEVMLHAQADTPEDAAARLAIELFKQGVLTRDDSQEPEA